MNNTFEWSRFVKLIKYDFWNMLHRGLAPLLILPALFVVNWLLSIVFGSTIEATHRWSLLSSFTFLIMLFGVSYMYGVVNVPKKGMAFAMLPASNCEKFWSMMLYSLIVMPLINEVLGVVVDSVLWILPFGGFKEPIWGALELRGNLALQGNMFQMDDIVVKGAVVTFYLASLSSLVLSHSIFFFSNTIFRRHKIIYTILSLVAIGMVVMMIVFPIMISMDVDNMRWFIRLKEALVSNPERVVNAIVAIYIAFNMLVAVGLYVWSYVRIKNARY